MREVFISDVVLDKVSDLRIYLNEKLKLSREGAHERTARIEKFIISLGNEADYPLCRFKKWNALGYRCAVFERGWVFVYEVFDDGVIVRDMCHVSLLEE